MIKKLMKEIINEIKSHIVFYLVLILVTPWLFIPFNYYIYMPGGLIDLTDRIEVTPEEESKGSFNLTYVSALKGTLPNILLSYIMPNWDLDSVDNSRIENESEKDITMRNKIFLKQTSYDAIIAAFKEANLPYEIERTELAVIHTFDYSDTKIKVGDIIKEIDGVKINNLKELQDEIQKKEENKKINVKVQRDKKEVNCTSIIKKEEDRLVIGVALAELKIVKTTPKVEYIFKNSESGASRGLLCALEIYNRITEYDLTKGNIISGTGSIDSEGNVGSIDGVKYKLIGAHKKGADVFIVPTDNYEEAIKIKKEKGYDIEIIKADTLHNVIEELKKR